MGKWEKWVTKARDRARSTVCGDSCSKLFCSILILFLLSRGILLDWKWDQVKKLGKLGHRSQDCEADPGFAETPAAAWSILVTIGHNAPSVASHEPTGKHWKYEKSKKSRNPFSWGNHKISWFQKNSHMSRPISPDLSLHDDFSFKPGRNSSKLVSGFNAWSSRSFRAISYPGVSSRSSPLVTSVALTGTVWAWLQLVGCSDFPVLKLLFANRIDWISVDSCYSPSLPISAKSSL